MFIYKLSVSFLNLFKKKAKQDMASQKEPYRLQYHYKGLKFLTAMSRRLVPILHGWAVEERKFCFCSKKEVQKLLSDYVKEFSECEKSELVFLN